MGLKSSDLNRMLEASDIVNISVPLTPSTESLISSGNLNHFKKSAILINAAREGVVNEEDLYQALKHRTLRAAACDAFVEEPPSGRDKLMTLDNFCATPHIGANTEEALYRMGMEVVEEVLNVIDGKRSEKPCGMNEEDRKMNKTGCVIVKDLSAGKGTGRAVCRCGGG